VATTFVYKHKVTACITHLEIGIKRKKIINGKLRLISDGGAEEREERLKRDAIFF
jgi:hypothetical protein